MKDLVSRLTNGVKKILVGGLACLAFSCLNGCEKPSEEGNNSRNLENATSLGKLAFVYGRYDKDKEGLWTVYGDGSGLKKICDNVSLITEGFISPYGDRIAFSDENDNQIIMDTEGNVLSQFHWKYFRGEDISWTPEGESILFGSYYDGIYRYDINNGNTVKLLNSASATYDHNPVMSPDRSRIIFTHHQYGSSYWIMGMNSDGSNVRVITNGSGTSHDERLNLNWLNNRDFIYKISPQKRVYFSNFDAGGQIELNPGKDFRDISLSPDKRTLALYGGTDDSLFFADTSGFSSGIIDPRDTGIDTYNFSWSRDSNHFVYGDWDGVYVGDKSGTEYKHVLDDSFNEVGAFWNTEWASSN